MVLALLSACFQSLTPLPTSKLGPSGADSRVSGFVHSRTLWVSPMNCPVMLGVSPAAASTPTSVFNQWFEVLFPRAGALGCAFCLTPQVFLLVYPQVNVGPPAPPAATLPQVLSARSLSVPPTSLDECFFFISLVVGLPNSLIFCQFCVVLSF